MCSSCYSSVKGDDICSDMFRVDFGVRQGVSFLSPYLFALYLDDLSCLCLSGYTIILYADDILFISPSICRLEKLLHICEKQLHWLDMAINFKKSCCLRIGPRCDTICMNLRSMTGSMLLWVDKIRYLGIHFVRAKYFKCSLNYAKRCFHQAANSIFGKIGRIASKNLYSNSLKENAYLDLRSLDFVIDHLFMKLFKTNNMDTLRQCQQFLWPPYVIGGPLYFCPVISFYLLLLLLFIPRLISAAAGWMSTTL